MSLKICHNGHLTGFRYCATCGTDKVEPLRPFRIVEREPKRDAAKPTAQAKP